jgi:hypothetical protein
MISRQSEHRAGISAMSRREAVPHPSAQSAASNHPRRRQRCYRSPMISIRFTALILLALSFVSCGGSTKAPDAAAQPPASPSAAPEPIAAKGEKAEAAPPTPAAEAEAAPTGPECKKDGDCTIFADCCSCKAVPASKPPLVPCDSVCGESKCEVKGITIVNVACDAGRCIIKKNK